MTLTLHLTPDQVARLQAEAARSGLSLNEYIQRRLLGDEFQVAGNGASHLSAIDVAMGALASSGISSTDFMNEKQAEVAQEGARWQVRFGP